MEAVAIKADKLKKIYFGRQQVCALDGVDLEVSPGETFGLLGPNGAGKTTTVGIWSTRIFPTSGRAFIGDTNVVRDPSRARCLIGVVPQFNTLDRACTAWENLYFHCRYFGFRAAQARKRADELLAQFYLTERAKAFPTELSAGMAQRLQLARAIAHYPRVLFLDEPTVGLDPQSRLAVWDMSCKLRSCGITVLLTTHNMEEADRLCDRVAIIDHGKILACDAPTSLKESMGARTSLNLYLDGASEAVREALSKLPGVVSVEFTASGLRVLASSRNGLLPRIFEALRGYPLRDFSVTEASLETVFIRLTGRELRE